MVVCCLSVCGAVCCSLFVARCLLRVVCCVVFLLMLYVADWRSLVVVCGLLDGGCCVMCGVVCWLLVFVVCCVSVVGVCCCLLLCVR